jgi:hypothetical protein
LYKFVHEREGLGTRLVRLPIRHNQGVTWAHGWDYKILGATEQGQERKKTIAALEVFYSV